MRISPGVIVDHGSFATEPRQTFGVGSEDVGEYLQRDVAIEPRIAGTIDLTHTSGTEGASDLVRSDAGTDLEGHA